MTSPRLRRLLVIFSAIVATMVLVAAIAVLSAAGGPPAAAPVRAARPSLVVVLVVDQFRADYIDRYGHMWTGGLRRLIDGGAWYRRAAYPYMNTVTCVGHATISTGTFPATSGIAGNSWFDRESGKSVGCADDSNVTTLSYGEPVEGGFSPARLKVPALADTLRTDLPAPPRIVTMSMKERTAIMLAGRRADAVTWFNSAAKGMVTSSFYTASPVPFVQRFVAANPIARDLGTAWTPLFPPSRYLYDDAGIGEKPPAGWTATFPHPLKGKGAEADTAFFDAWEESPWSDAYLGKLAEAAVDAMKLGQERRTDLLAVSFSALDLVGHDFGPRSHEVQDVLARLDRTIGSLLAHLDRRVGAGRYVVALSGDHGVSPIPEQITAAGLDAGRQPRGPIGEIVETVLGQAFGAGKHIARLSGGEIYLAPATAARIREAPAVRAELVEKLSALPGVARVFFADQLANRRPADDRDALAAALSFVPGRSGDIIVVARPNWFFVAGDGSLQPGSAATHGTLADYDRRVPLVLYGFGIRPGEQLRAVTPADIAPTLAFLCGVTLAKPDGEVLAEAVRR